MWVEEKRGRGLTAILRPAMYGVCTGSLFTFKCNYFFHKSSLWPITNIAAHITPRRADFCPTAFVQGRHCIAAFQVNLTFLASFFVPFVPDSIAFLAKIRFAKIFTEMI